MKKTILLLLLWLVVGNKALYSQETTTTSSTYQFDVFIQSGNTGGCIRYLLSKKDFFQSINKQDAEPLLIKRITDKIFLLQYAGDEPTLFRLLGELHKIIPIKVSIQKQL